MTKRIKRNIEEFAKKIFDLISDSSAKRHERLTTVFTETKTRYTQEGYKRARATEFDTAITELKDFPDAINCMLLVANFVSTGGWEINSGNTLLFFKLIDLTGYERDSSETDDYLHEQVITELKDAVRELIVKHVKEYEARVKEEDEQNQKSEALRVIKLQNLDNILLCDSHELAKETQLANPEKTTFCLVCNPVELENKAPEWQLFQYDLEGKANFLPLGVELLSLLTSLKINQHPSPNADSYNLIKAFCYKLIEDNHDLYLFDDGERAGKFSRKHPEKHCLCLSTLTSSNNSNSLKWQLTWYDLHGKPNHLSLSDELAKLTTALTVARLPASDTLMHYDIKAQCLPVVKEQLGKIHVLINPAQDALRNLEGTFVLTWSLPTVKLQWYDMLGIRQDIALAKFPALNTWLKEQSELTADKIPQLKTYLMHLTVRREVVEKKPVFDFLQKEHGITLIAANDINKIPAFKLVAGVYILTRDPLDNTGEWLLYLRHKGNINERINIDNWEAFNQILLEKNELMPNDLSATIKNTLRDTIISSLNLFKNTKRLCLAVDEFLPEQGSNYRGGSFVITKENDIWALYYINAFQKALSVDLKHCPAQQLVQELTGEPASLNRDKLDELDKLLSGFKPASHLNMANFSKVTTMFSDKYGTSASKQKELPQIKSPQIESPERVKLDMSKFGDVGALFGAAPTRVEPEVLDTVTNKLGS